MRSLNAALGALFICCAPVLADDYKDYQRPLAPEFQTNIRYQQPPSRFDSFVTTVKDFYNGAVLGDVIEHQNVSNILGQLTISFSPASLIADGRDFSVNSFRSAATGFKEHKAAMVLSAAGVIPAGVEINKLHSLYKAEREAVLAERALKIAGFLADKSLVRAAEALPPIKADYAAEFVELRARTFKAGEKVFRSPGGAQFENAFTPGRWFGTRGTVTTSAGADSLYQAGKHGNKNELLRSYEFKQDVTVFYGKVKGGTGYQVYFPDDITPGDVLRWTGVKRLK